MRRWIYCNEGTAEWEAKQAALKAIDAWWEAFEKKTSEFQDLFSGRSEWDLTAWMHEHLHAIDDRLMWEFGPSRRHNGHRLVLTPEGEHHLWPLLESVMEKEPELPGWEFRAGRQAESLDAAIAVVNGRIRVDISKFKVTVDFEDGAANLTYHVPQQIYDADDMQGVDAAFVATEVLLGEDLLDRWVGQIETTPPVTRMDHILGLQSNKKSDHEAVSLGELFDIVSRNILDFRKQLPRKYRYEMIEEAEWGAFELQPEEADDYPCREDLIVCVSGCPEIHKAALIRPLFSSVCFSTKGETFIYLKIDASQGVGSFVERSDLQDALSRQLIANEQGCCIGGGTGLRYWYVDIACRDLDACITTAQNILRDAKISHRSWILFFDSRMSGEWVGVYPDSPQPPELDE